MFQTYHPYPKATEEREQLVQTKTITNTSEFCGSTCIHGMYGVMYRTMAQCYG